jgi:hypothetical protein
MEIKLTMRSMEMNSSHFFELPVFTVPQQEPEAYLFSVRETKDILAAKREGGRLGG